MNNLLRNIPSVTELLENPQLKALSDSVGRSAIVGGVRQFLDKLRNQVQTASGVTIPDPAQIATQIASWIKSDQKPAQRPVINATGVLLHTNLGRAPLSDHAIQAMGEVARGYASVEFSLEDGERAHRSADVEKWLTRLTGAESALVVNNCAGATLLALAATSAGKEVIVSRGELIEIGGSYRLPDVMQSSGAILKEVGTTNKTRSSDYSAAVSHNTGAVLRAHCSNYRVIGFTESATLAELVQVARKAGVPMIDDVGSGALIDFSRYGLQGEPLVADSIRAGADLVLFSGDKLLGGPQCGIVVGKRELIAKLSKHPLMRALRVDKVTLAALSSTLQAYQDIELAERSIPLLMLLATPLENLRLRAERTAQRFSAHLAASGSNQYTVKAVQSETFLGGGSIPTQKISTWCVAVTASNGKLDDLAAALRTGSPAVVGRIHDGQLLLDFRSVLPRQDAELLVALENLVVASAAPEIPTPPPAEESTSPAAS